jgi:general secretion pathway protein N
VATILARPLFRDNRRPVADAAAAVASRGDDQARLSGVVTGPFGNLAIFTSAANPKPIVVHVGGRISGAIVRTIEPGRVVVESGSGVHTLTPVFADAKPARRR